MRILRERLNTRREGATLITVVIAAAFLIAVGFIILAASTKYLTSTYMDRNANVNLYDAEGVMAEVKAGLLEYAGNAGEAAYRDVVENYEVKSETETTHTGGIDITHTVTSSLKDKFAREYICGIIDQLNGETITPATGIKHKLPSKTPEIDESNPGKAVLVERKQFPLANIRCLTPYGDKDIPQVSLPESGSSTGVVPGDEITYYSVYYSKTKGYYLMIENLLIDHTDDAGYRSTVHTDVQLLAPDYKFDGEDKLKAASDFISISDGDLNVNLGGTQSNFIGNVYAGGYRDKDNTGQTNRNGVFIGQGCRAHFNCEKLITRGDITAMTGSKVDIYGVKDTNTGTAGWTDINTLKDSADGEVYARNIILKPIAPNSPSYDTKNGTHLTMAANSYIENDLDIQDSATTVTLGGKYIGYSYNQNNSVSGTDDKGEAKYSSAILINGISTTLKSIDAPSSTSEPDNKLQRLVLAGRSFVSRNKAGGASGINVPDSIAQPDIMMGESVSIRSNQMAYLVPERYVLVKHNPLSSADAGEVDDAGNLTDFSDPTSLVDIEALKKTHKSSNDGLWDYLDEGTPVTGNYVQAGAGDGAYVYLFLNFKDQHSANEYFQKFFNGDFVIEKTDIEDEDNIPDDVKVDDLRDQALAYISSKDEDGNPVNGMRLSPAYYLIAGNIIENIRGEGGMSYQSPTYYNTSGKPDVDSLLEGQKIGKTYVSLATSLTTKNKSGSMRLDESAVSPLVTTGLIAVDEIPNSSGDQFLLEDGTIAGVYSNKNTGGTSSAISMGVTAGKQALVMSRGNITVDVSFSGVVVSGGDVTVTKDFKGLIIAAGEVKVSGNVTLQSNPVLVKRLLSYAVSSDQYYKVFRAMKNPDTHNSTDMNDCFRYINWEKNNY